MKKMTPEELESFLHRELRALPAPRAPRTLESRVLAALEQQATIPWYHCSWTYWPAAVRGLFLAVATLAAGGFLAAALWLAQGFEPGALTAQIGERLGGLRALYHLTQWLGDFSRQLLGSVPRLWLWGTLATFLALNATFFGLGAVAYRTLYRKN